MRRKASQARDGNGQFIIFHGPNCIPTMHIASCMQIGRYYAYKTYLNTPNFKTGGAKTWPHNRSKVAETLRQIVGLEAKNDTKAAKKLFKHLENIDDEEIRYVGIGSLMHGPFIKTLINLFASETLLKMRSWINEDRPAKQRRLGRARRYFTRLRRELLPPKPPSTLHHLCPGTTIDTPFKER